MYLDLHTIKKITTGAVRIEKEKDGIHFYRFTKEQELLYQNRTYGSHLYDKTFQNAGIRITFKTDSRTLFLKGNILFGGVRGFYSLDVFADGQPIGYIDNFSPERLGNFYAQVSFPFGPFEKSFSLGDGMKTVSIYLPWSAILILEEMALDDHAEILPTRPGKTLLAFGDSITHGNDALRPSACYAAKLCNALDATAYNKAIAGEVFFPDLAKTQDDISPDYITVAYGTNDWSNLEKNVIRENCTAFFEALWKNYPNARIFAITPIWRADMQEDRAAGDFMGIPVIIADAVKNIPNASVIQGIDLVPHDITLYADGRLHPNDAGFAFYAENLIREIRARL